MNKKKLMTAVLAVALAATMLVGGTVAYFHDTTETVKNTFTLGNVSFEEGERALDEGKVGTDGKWLDRYNNRVISNDYSTTKMVPGYVYDKDPTIHLSDDSEDAYLFLDITLNKFNSLAWAMAADASEDGDIAFELYDEQGAVKTAFQNESGVFSSTAFFTYLSQNKEVAQAIINKWFYGINHADWTVEDVFSADQGQTLTVRLGYNSIATAGADICFMTGFGMPASLTQQMMDAGVTVGNMQTVFNCSGAVLNLNFTAYAIQASGLDTLADAYAVMF